VARKRVKNRWQTYEKRFRDAPMQGSASLRSGAGDFGRKGRKVWHLCVKYANMDDLWRSDVMPSWRTGIGKWIDDAMSTIAEKRGEFQKQRFALMARAIKRDYGRLKPIPS
jgi:hypothetical protein